MARKANPKKTPAKTSADRLIDAALTLAAEKPWSRVDMAEIAAAAGLSLAEAYDAFPCRAALMRALVARHDRAMLADEDPALAEESRRDRLFDVIMRRLEAMRPHKAALRSMAMGASTDPGALLALGPSLMTSVGWMLRAAGAGAEGPLGFVRQHALALVYIAAVRAFFQDEADDLSTTMAALDKALKRAGRALGA